MGTEAQNIKPDELVVSYGEFKDRQNEGDLISEEDQKDRIDHESIYDRKKALGILTSYIGLTC